VIVRSFTIGVSLLVLLPTIACDRWKASFRVDPRVLVRPPAGTPLPNSGFAVRWEPHSVAPAMARGSAADARIAFTNLGDVTWPDVVAGDPAAHSGGYAVRLAYEWIPASAPPGTKPRRRADLPHAVRAGETMTLLVPIDAPNEPGEYRLTFELVQELVVWFESKGAATLVVPVTVR
jgi:hypothetical protein